MAPMMDTSDMDPELARYLNRNYWEKKNDNLMAEANKASATTPSAPTAANEPTAQHGSPGAAVKVTEVSTRHLCKVITFY